MPLTQTQRGKQPFPDAASKRQYVWSAERRRYVRYPCAWQVQFRELDANSPKTFHMGKCKNVSQGGLKITSFQPLSRNAIVLLEADFNLFAKYIKLGDILCVSENRVLARVRWRHLNLETRLFEAGLEFLDARRERDYHEFIMRAQAIPTK